MTKVLMVCLGNICRSPLAEGILKSKVISFKIGVDSAGTGAYHINEKPDKRSRKFILEDFDEFDFIYVMDNSNYRDVIALARNKNDKSKVKLILNEVFTNENLNVPDPYYGGDLGFKNVYNMLDEACDIIAKKINKNG